ncbi:MAG: lasso peptide biosynthesis B2 protein [Novosphingobium sp.]
MRFWHNWPKQTSLREVESWRLRCRTIEAMGALVLARAVIAALHLSRWNRHFGLAGTPTAAQCEEACRLSAHVRRAAQRLPLNWKCLPQALALSRMLRRRGVPHLLVIAARPAGARSGADDLHAWIAAGDMIVLGALPGPWLPVLTLPRQPAELAFRTRIIDK